jgi:hypothetical protein
MDFAKNKAMSRRPRIDIELIKLVGGKRVIRLSTPSSPLVLEQKLDPKQAVLAQEKLMVAAYEAALAQASSVN